MVLQRTVRTPLVCHPPVVYLPPRHRSTTTFSDLDRPFFWVLVYRSLPLHPRFVTGGTLPVFPLLLAHAPFHYVTLGSV